MGVPLLMEFDLSRLLVVGQVLSDDDAGVFDFQPLDAVDAELVLLLGIV